jgi:hypothetical protein
MADKVEVLLAIGESLTKAQTRERHAAEVYRLTPSKSSLAAWLGAVREIEQLTNSYMDASMDSVERKGPADRMPMWLHFRESRT